MSVNWKPNSLTLAIAAAVVLAIWLLSGDLRTAATESEGLWEEREATLSRVEYRRLQAEPYQPEIVVQGQLQPWQRVEIRARVQGFVEVLPVALGASVSEGEVLVQLSDDGRTPDQTRAAARLRHAEAELSATRRLRRDNLVSESDLLRAESDVASAQADLEQARLMVSQIQPRAPFDSVVNRRHVELGDFVQPGEPLLELVNTDRLKLTAAVPQQKAGDLAVGQSIEVSLLDGRTLSGELTHVASLASPETRTFAIEAVVENPEGWRVAGASATLRIQTEETLAARLSPAYLTLNEDGKLGVTHVDEDDRVAFTVIDLLSVSTREAWVGGLPPEIRLITQGAGFVHPGDSVNPVSANEDP